MERQYCTSCTVNDTNSAALSTSLYEQRTYIRQVLVVHGNFEVVIAATDDGLIITELKKQHTVYYLSGGLERTIYFTKYRED